VLCKCRYIKRNSGRKRKKEKPRKKKEEKGRKKKTVKKEGEKGRKREKLYKVIWRRVRYGPKKGF
jgi:hypothetical protein